MKNDTIENIIIAIICTIIVVSLLCAGALSGYTECNNQWKKVLIEKKYAEYNSQTGEWQWKEPELTEGINQGELKIEPSDS